MSENLPSNFPGPRSHENLGLFNPDNQSRVCRGESLGPFRPLQSPAQLRLQPLTLSPPPPPAQLKQQDANSAGKRQAIEELEKSISLAEAASPGITDKMVKKLMEKFQK